MLTMIGGDIGSFKNQLLSMRDVTSDSDIAMASWASSLDMAGNSFTRLQGSMFTFLDIIGSEAIDAFSGITNALSDLDEAVPGVTSGMIAFGASLTVGLPAISKLKSGLGSLMKAQKAAIATTNALTLAEKSRATASLLIPNPWVLAAGAIAVTAGLLTAYYVNAKKKEEERSAQIKKTNKDIYESTSSIYNMQLGRMKIQNTINGQLSTEAKQWSTISGLIDSTSDSMSKFYSGIKKEDLTTSLLDTYVNKKTYQQIARDEYYEKQSKIVNKLEVQKLGGDDVDEKVLQKERAKLKAAMKIRQQDAGSEAAYGLLEYSSKRELIRRSSDTSIEGSARQYQLDLDTSNFEKELTQNLPSTIQSAVDANVVTTKEAINDLKMSAKDFSESAKKRAIELQNDYNKLVQSPTSKLAATKEAEMLRDRITAYEEYVKGSQLERENLVAYNDAKLEVLKLEKEYDQKVLDTYQENVNRLSKFHGALQKNITKLEASLLSKANISNVGEMLSAITDITKSKKTSTTISGLMQPSGKGGIGLTGADLFRTTKGGSDFSYIQKEREFGGIKKLVDKDIVKKQKKASSDTGISENQIAKNMVKFENATEKERKEIVSNLKKRVQGDTIEDKKKQQNIDLLFLEVRNRVALIKEQELYRSNIMNLKNQDLKRSTFIFHKDWDEQSKHMKAMANARTDAEKIAVKTNMFNEKTKNADKKLLIAKAEQVKDRKKLEVDLGVGIGGGKELDAYKALGIDVSSGEAISEGLLSMFDNKSLAEMDAIILNAKGEIPELIIEQLKSARASRTNIENAEKETLELIIEKNNQLIELSKLRNRIRLNMIDESGDRKKLESRRDYAKVSGGESIGFGKVQEYKILKLDQSIIEEKISYLRSIESTADTRSQIANLEKKGFDLEMESYEKKKGAIRDVANLGLSQIVNAATTGEMPRVDNAALMSSFGDLAATFLGGDAPDIPQETLRVEEDQLKQLEIISRSIKELGGDATVAGGFKEAASMSIKDVAEKGVDYSLNIGAADGKKKGLIDGVGRPTGTGASVESESGFSFSGAVSNFKSKWTGKDAEDNKLANEDKFSSTDKARMGVQGAQMAIGVINSFTQMEADYKLQSLKVEKNILELRLQGAETEEEKLALEKEIYNNKKRQIKAGYESKTQFMGASGGTGAVLGGMTSGAASGAMMGSAGGTTGMAIGAGIGAATGLISGWMGGNKAKSDMKQQMAALKVQQDIKKLNEDRNKMLEANNTFMGTFGKYAGKIGIEEGMNAAFKSIKDTGTMAVGGAGIESWSKKHGSGKKKYTTQESIQKTVGLSDIGMSRDSFDSLADTEEAIIRTNKKISDIRNVSRYSFMGMQADMSHESKAMLKAYENMLKNLKSIADVHKSNIAIYKSYFGAKLTEEKDGDRITGYSADWSDFRSELLATASDQALAGMDANVQKFTKNFFDGITDAFVQNSSDLNNIISKSVIPAYDLIANVLNGEYGDMDAFNHAYNDAMANASSASETSKKHELNNLQVKKSMELLALATKQYKEEQSRVNKTVGEFEDTWVSAGGKISDILDSATQGTKDLYNSLMTSIGDGSKAGLESLIGSDIIKGIGEANMKDVLDSLGQNIVDISKAATDGKGSFEGFESAINDYLKISDALGDFERYKDELKDLGLSDEEIAKLEYQLKLQELLNDKLEERMTLSDLLSNRQSAAENEIKKMITEISKAGGYDNVDQIVKDRYQEIIDELQKSKGDIKEATKEFTKAK